MAILMVIDWAEKNIIASVDTDISAIVPASTLNDVSRVIGDDVKEVVIGVGEDQIEFIVGQTIINSRLIDGNFINYRQLIPTSTETEAVLDRAELLHVLLKYQSCLRARVLDRLH